MNTEDLRKLRPHPLAALLPMIDGEDYKALVEDVRKHGAREPITLYQGLILDGRNRVAAAIECGRPVNINEHDGDEASARALVMSLNVHRRHLTPAEKREMVKVELKANPEQSDRAIAEKVRVDKNTVAVQREKLEATGEIHQLTQRTGKDGKTRAAKPKVAMPPGTGTAIDEHNRRVKAEKKAAAAWKPTRDDSGWYEAREELKKVKGQITRIGRIDVEMSYLLMACAKSSTDADRLREYLNALLREIDRQATQAAAAVH